MSCGCDFGSGLGTCHCAGCHRTFTSISAFDLHQRIDGGRNVCLDPAEARRRNGDPVFAVCRLTAEGPPVWGQYDPRGVRPVPAAMAHENVGAGI